MINTLLSVMNYINNHFVRSREEGDYEIKNGIISLSKKYAIGQYIYIVGSLLNDGLYLINDRLITLDDSMDESFSGTIYGLGIPSAFIQLVDEIELFSNSAEGQASNITSASFGIQSYSWATDANGNRAGWETVFAKRLNQYRRMTADIDILGGAK